MAFCWFIFRLFCLICCIVVLASYNIGHRPSINDRKARAVTEWRFRRNYLFHFPYFVRNDVRNNRLLDHPDNRNGEMKVKEKKISSFLD